jgi:Family of unknown function (DUF6335)
MAARKPAKRRQSGKQRRTGGRAKARSSPRAKTTKRAKSTRRAAPARRRPATRANNKKRSAKPAAPKGTRKVRVRAARAPVRPQTPAPPPRGRRPVSPVLLDRERRQLPESERAEPLPAQEDRLIAAARTGHDELQQSLLDHTETSPKLTAGDVDAKWQDAYAVGDEAPGGDNPTPDQDRVDDIGRALGIQYQDNEELNPDEKVRERDRHRWELDPASSDDWPHKDTKK